MISLCQNTIWRKFGENLAKIWQKFGEKIWRKARKAGTHFVHPLLSLNQHFVANFPPPWTRTRRWQKQFHDNNE
jgi:hypothetical protein